MHSLAISCRPLKVSSGVLLAGIEVVEDLALAALAASCDHNIVLVFDGVGPSSGVGIKLFRKNFGGSPISDVLCEAVPVEGFGTDTLMIYRSSSKAYDALLLDTNAMGQLNAQRWLDVKRQQYGCK